MIKENLSDKYSQRGVSASKLDVHQAIKKLDKGLFPKAFCKIIPDIIDNDDGKPRMKRNRRVPIKERIELLNIES